MRFFLDEQMPSGKNRIKFAWRGGKMMRYPDVRFKRWRATAWSQLNAQRQDWKTLQTPGRVIVDYWPGDRIRRDVPGMMDALCHLLEWCPIHKAKSIGCVLPFVFDDSLLAEWEWHPHEIDRVRPRLEFTLECKEYHTSLSSAP